jgi:hypothetical protein
MAFCIVEQRRQTDFSMHMLLGRRFVLDRNCEEQVIPIHGKHSFLFGLVDVLILVFDVEFVLGATT